MRLTSRGKAVTVLAVGVVAVGLAVGGALTAHASSTPAASSASVHTTDAPATPSPTPTPALAPPVPPPDSLARAAQGTWTTTDTAGTRTVHDLARGVVAAITPVVLVVRTRTGATVPFALPLTSDDVREMHGGTATSVPYTSVRVGTAVTVTGVVPASTQASMLSAIWPPASGQ